MNPIPTAVLIGGGLYVLSRGAAGPALMPGDVGFRDPRYGATMGDIANGVPNGGYTYDPYLDDAGQAGFNVDGRLTDPDARQKLDLLNVAMQKAYGAMSGAAKSAAADQLNTKLALDPPLRGNESWDQISSIAGAAVGGVACNAIPGIGTAASPLCAMAGSYLGVQLEQWMQTEVPGLQSWVSDNLGAVVDTIGDKLSEWWNDIF